jgi:hypothetical protein
LAESRGQVSQPAESSPLNLIVCSRLKGAAAEIQSIEAELYCALEIESK